MIGQFLCTILWTWEPLAVTAESGLCSLEPKNKARATSYPPKPIVPITICGMYSRWDITSYFYMKGKVMARGSRRASDTRNGYGHEKARTGMVP